VIWEFIGQFRSVDDDDEATFAVNRSNGNVGNSQKAREGKLLKP